MLLWKDRGKVRLERQLSRDISIFLGSFGQQISNKMFVDSDCLVEASCGNPLVLSKLSSKRHLRAEAKLFHY